ncbi:MAG: type I glutamate--ammonia ligase [Christensenellales bacterium]|jgi:glutamine synthetase
MAKKFSNKDVLKLVEEKDVQFIRLQFTDVFGILKNVAITARQLEHVLEEGCMFDGSSIDGFVRIEESDMLLMPDTDTFEIFPWKPQQGNVARLICDVYTTNGNPYVGCPRYILKKTLEEAAKMGYTMNVGPECEFFLFHTDADGKPTTITHDEGGYFDLAPIDKGEDARRDMCLALEEMGFEIETSHHEVAEGQHEIDFKYKDALTTADSIMTFKIVVKTIAARHGLYATFMPKPIFGISGSGMHANQSLFTKDGNAFYDKNGELQLSSIAYNYIAGMMEHIESIVAVTNPIVNSYKRLVPGYEAPCYIAWSAQNRSPLIRIPASRGAGTRMEVRCPDPAANPYLAIALMLAAGLDGIKRSLTPPPPVNKNIYELTQQEMETLGILSLPGSLYDALQAYKADPLIKETLGDHIFNTYYEFKKKEWDHYRKAVHPWEINQYLTKY